jgi:hypothetical protein
VIGPSGRFYLKLGENGEAFVVTSYGVSVEV